jgi:hypothetical protein
MSILTLLVVGGVVAIAVYLFNRFVPGDPKIKQVVTWAAVAVLIIWVFRGMGGCEYLSKARI